MEDSEVTFDELRKQGLSEDVIAVLDCLTKCKGESYDKFIDRVIKNKTACRVKLEDLYDNMDLTRIKNPTDEDIARIKKYREAADRISNTLSLKYGI